ncbi:3262_t:CDS:2, partial [Racocetra persica]
MHLRGQGEYTPWFNRFGHPTHYLVQVVVNGELPEDDITGFAQWRRMWERKGWASIVLLRYLLE